MSITVELDLPEDSAKEAREKGLLEPARLGVLLSEELHRERARKGLGQMIDELHTLPGEPMTYGEIQVEVDAVREERRRDESGH